MKVKFLLAFGVFFNDDTLTFSTNKWLNCQTAITWISYVLLSAYCEGM